MQSKQYRDKIYHDFYCENFKQPRKSKNSTNVQVTSVNSEDSQEYDDLKSGEAEHIAIALLSSSDGENDSLADRITKQNKRNVE